MMCASGAGTYRRNRRPLKGRADVDKWKGGVREMNGRTGWVVGSRGSEVNWSRSAIRNEWKRGFPSETKGIEG